ncbi:MAG TPA: GNAT family N-acetyltransferase [Longimicrobium sp.]|nr:GNAT family N-acetyltransferase [Longimicrobium sp.]
MTRSDPPLVIRPANEDDVPALASLATHLGYPTTEAQMRARMQRIGADANYATLVAETNGRVIGYAGMTWKWAYVDDRPRGELLSLVVSPEARGQGAGAALMAAAEEWMRQHGAGSVHLTTALHRDRAHAFYERIGYTRTGYRYVKKFGEGEKPA